MKSIEKILKYYKIADYPRVMSLKDGTKKMSKSEPNDLTRINLTDYIDVVIDKIFKARTDSIPTVRTDEQRPEVSNLIRIYCALEGISEKQANSKFEMYSL